jgi:hypothetical protein
MRGLFLSASWVLFVSASALAQGGAAAANWARVQQLPLHTKVHIASDKVKRVCSIDSVTADSLTCSSGSTISSFPRAEIKSIKVTRRGLSTLGGAAIGAGVGFAVGAALTAGESHNDIIYISAPQAGGVGAAVGAVVGAAIGAPTDFLRGPTVYERGTP